MRRSLCRCATYRPRSTGPLNRIVPTAWYRKVFWKTVGAGVGVVVVHVDGDGDVFPSEIATSVDRVFRGSGIAGLHTSEEVDEALGRLHNILAELAGLLHGLRLVPRGRAATIVHDYGDQRVDAGALEDQMIRA